MKTATLEVVSKEVERDANMQNLKELHTKLVEKINSTTEELAKKVYIIEGKVPTAKNIVNFLQNDAQWKFTESMGILEAVKEVEKTISEVKKGNTKEIYFSPLVIEATYYFLTKVEGKGLNEAKYYFEELLKPVSDALSRSKSDREILDQMQRDLATLENALEQGANLDDKLVKEIAHELENGVYFK
jgi:hypothetical protein